MRYALILVLALGSCGRLGFDELEGALDSTVDTVPPVACTVAACPPDYIPEGGGCYRVVTTPTDWLAAELACEADGGHLVVEDSVDEHFTIHTIVAGLSQVWVGWTDRRGPDNVFQWVVPDGGGLLQSNTCVFDNGEPDAGDNDHCVSQNGTNACPDYQDVDCALTLPYVCECDGVIGDPTRY